MTTAKRTALVHPSPEVVTEKLYNGANLANLVAPTLVRQFRVATERRKNRRFEGRSANRRMK